MVHILSQLFLRPVKNDAHVMAPPFLHVFTALKVEQKLCKNTFEIMYLQVSWFKKY